VVDASLRDCFDLIVVPIQITPERITHERKHHGQPRPSIPQNGVTRPYRTGQKRMRLSLNSPQILTCKLVLPTSTALENDVFSKQTAPCREIPQHNPHNNARLTNGFTDPQTSIDPGSPANS
jgi:hypothetical protein